MGLSEPLIESQVLTYLKGLSAKGNQISILSFEKYKFLPKGRINRIKGSLRGHDIKWFFLRYHKSPAFFAKIFDLLAGFIFGFYIILTEGINVIHARGTMPAFFSFFISKMLSRRFVFDMRGLMAKEYVDGKIWKKSNPYYWIADFLEKIIMKYSDNIVVLTEKIKGIIGAGDYLGIDITSRITVIPTAVDAGLFNIKKHPLDAAKEKLGLGDRFVFLYIGSLGTWYMFEEMAEFVKVNRSNFKEPFFLIITQSDTREARRLLRNIGLNEKDFAIIYSKHEDIPGYINASDAGMMFIKSCFSKDASCPTKFGEYLACGLPVVLNSGIGDCDRIMVNYKVGVMVDGFEASKYLGSGLELKRMMEDRDEISKICREVAIKEFSLDYAVDSYDRIYKEA